MPLDRPPRHLRCLRRARLDPRSVLRRTKKLANPFRPRGNPGPHPYCRLPRWAQVGSVRAEGLTQAHHRAPKKEARTTRSGPGTRPNGVLFTGNLLRGGHVLYTGPIFYRIPHRSREMHSVGRTFCIAGKRPWRLRRLASSTKLPSDLKMTSPSIRAPLHLQGT